MKRFLCMMVFAGLAAVVGAVDYKFDLGPGKQPAASGWIRLGERDLFGKDKSYGWEKIWGYGYTDKAEGPLGSAIGARAPKDIGVLKVKLPDGVYKVTVQLGSNNPREGRDGQCVAINGRAVLPPPGVGGWGKLITRTLPAVVTDGVLVMQFYTPAAKGTHRLNLYSIRIEEAKSAEKATLEAQFNAAATPDAAKPVSVEFRNHKLNRIGPAAVRSAFEPTGPEGMVFCRKDFSGDLLDDGTVQKSELIKLLSGFATPGETESFFIGLYGLRPVQVEAVKLSELRGTQGVIPAEATEVFTLTTVYRSPHDTINFDARKTAELFEKNFPFALVKGRLQGLYFTVRIPKNAKPGVYRGALTAQTATGKVSLPIELTVHDVKLARPEKDFVMGTDDHRYRTMSDQAITAELCEFADYGINGVMTGMAPISGILLDDAKGNIVGADFDRTTKALKTAQKIGLNRVLLLNATNQLLWQIPGFSVNHRGKGRHVIEDGIFTIRHEDASATSALGSTHFPAVFPGRRGRFSIEYALEGKGAVSAELRLLNRLRKSAQPTQRLHLAPSGDYRSASVEFDITAPTEIASLSMNYRGQGALKIREIRFSPLDREELNFLPNGKLQRPIDRIDYNKPWPEHLRQSYHAAVKANADAARKLGFTPYIVGTDEAGNNPKNEKQEIAELAEVHAAGEKTFCNLSPALARKSLDHLDIVCFYADLTGDAQKTREIIDYYRSKGKKVYGISAGTYAGQNFSVMTNRYNSGFYLALNDFDGLWFWTFQRPCNDPYDDFDARTKDYCLVYPARTPGGMPVRSVAYEGIREGIRDYTYFDNLKRAILRAEKAGRKADAAAGSAVLACVKAAIPEYGSFDERVFNDRKANELRKLLLLGIEAAEGKRAFGNGQLAHAPQVAFRAQTTAKTPASLSIIPFGSAAKALGVDRFFDHIRGSEEKGTAFALRHDDRNLYITATAMAPKTAVVKGSGEAAGFTGDHFEILIDPTLGRNAWKQFAVNRAGQKSELECVGSRNATQSIFAVNYNDHKRSFAWNGPWEAVVREIAGGWQADITIPWTTLGATQSRLGMLLGRSGFGKTVGNCFIGFFDQPEKFPVYTLSGSSGLLYHDLSAPKTGRVTGNFRFAHLKSGRVELREYDNKDNLSGFSAGLRADGTAALTYRLTERSKRLEVDVFDGANRKVWHIVEALKLPPALTADVGTRVFDDQEGTLSAAIRCHVTDALWQAGTISFAISSNGKELWRSSYPVLDGEFRCRLGNFSGGFYQLTIQLHEKGRIYAQEVIPFVILSDKNK